MFHNTTVQEEVCACTNNHKLRYLHVAEASLSRYVLSSSLYYYHASIYAKK